MPHTHVSDSQNFQWGLEPSLLNLWVRQEEEPSGVPDSKPHPQRSRPLWNRVIRASSSPRLSLELSDLAQTSCPEKKEKYGLKGHRDDSSLSNARVKGLTNPSSSSSQMGGHVHRHGECRGPETGLHPAFLTPSQCPYSGALWLLHTPPWLCTRCCGFLPVKALCSLLLKQYFDPTCLSL